MDLALLKQEIEKDPLGLGYGPLMDRGSDADVAVILNDKSGPGGGVIQLPSIPLSDFLGATLPAIVALQGKTSDVQAKWDRLINIVTSLPTVTLTPTVRIILQGLVVDGLMGSDDVNAIGTRQGSRAEVLFGPGTVIHHLQIAAAFGRGTGV